MDAKTENAIAPLVAQLQARDDALDQSIIEWAGRNLSPQQANTLIQMVRESQSSIDVHNELATFAAILTQPVTTN
jgi:hypothetical protein